MGALAGRGNAIAGDLHHVVSSGGHVTVRVDDRRVISGIFHVLRTGTPWSDLPERCGPHATVCNRYNRWAKQGVREQLFEALAGKGDQDHAIGHSRGGLSAKIHVVVDGRAILKRIADHGSCPHIPTQRDRREQRSVSHHLYRQRNLVERFFNKLKRFRGIATRDHKLARNFLAAIALASIRLWIKINEYTT